MIAFPASCSAVPSRPRWLGGPGPSEPEIETLLKVASRVPDHGKLVPWRFILIEGEARQRLGEVLATAFQADNPERRRRAARCRAQRFAQAPLVVAVVSRVVPHVKIPDWEQVLSAGAVCMNLLNGATALGYGASWLSGWASFDRRVLDALGLAGRRADRRLHPYRHRAGDAGRPRPAEPRATS